MRSLLRWGVRGVAVLLLAAALVVVPNLVGKPWSIDLFFLRSLVLFALDHPQLLSYARPLDAWGLDFYSDELEDYSVAADLALADRVDETLKGLLEYDREGLSADQQISYDAGAWLLRTYQEGRPFLFHDYPINQFSGTQSSLPDFMVNIHQVENERDARDYLARLRGFGRALQQLGESVSARAERGVIPPRFVLEAVEAEMRGFVASPPRENILYTELEDALTAAGVEDATRASLADEAERVLLEVVYPGYGELIELVGVLHARAADEDGVWKLPDGDAYYRWALKLHTTTDLGPDRIHEIGRTEIRRIHTEMRSILQGEGLPSAEPIATLLDLNREPRFLYPDTDAGRAAILSDYQAIIDETSKRLPEFFGRLPEAQVQVERVPVFKEAGAAGAYYNPPSLDGARPGVFYVNLRDVAEIPRFGMRTLTFHEALPGHHLQITTALEADGLPLFRRFMPLTVFVEGWALYAERLAMEAGFHETPYDRLGALSAELFRAVRLVVDTGIHAERWSRAQAIQYMIENAGLPAGDARSEIERYIVNPGQACAYKVGQLRILELRERARSRLGSAFDLRGFHDLVLSNGALPLDVLDRVVAQWVPAAG
jgi:uncharacterized protein (DUF885 family)